MCCARAKQCLALISYPVMSAPATPYKCMKASPRRSMCPDLDNTNLNSSPPDIMPYLNVEMRGWIVGMCQAGLPFRAISDLAGVPLTMVYDKIKKYECFGTVQTEKKTGRPPIMNAQDRRELNHIITRGCRLTVAQVTDLLTHQVFTWTIQHEIHELGKQSRIAPKKPYLRPQDFQQCLAFAQAHRHWKINDWDQVIWTDESAFELGKKVDWVRVWRTPEEKWKLENLAVNHRSGRQMLMVWGAFCAAMQAPLVFLNSRMTLAEMVQQVYQPGLLPFIAWMEQAPWIHGCQHILLMEDNAPNHTARGRTNWQNQHNIQKLDWPAH
ncbi:hypothetical protein O181_122849 [Austropuccinia psidii MF-1]|uniref:Tc1-like transposase DDE domain-containing protein n=1 Tax=Austropuccinia psidii MF-1 TaxID=1389203 RepID=A0A9Q3KNW3_9BASI|nr:hypothetical protein [Austropuccinia psidii MF-1]